MITIITCDACGYDYIEDEHLKCPICTAEVLMDMNGVPYAEYEDADAYDEEREREQDEKDFAQDYMG